MATINDIVLIYVDGKPGFYARIEDINPDIKPGWWHVDLLVLTFPLQNFHWTLDENQLLGDDFTMGGTPLRMEEIISPLAEARRVEEEKEEERKKKVCKEQVGAKVVSLNDRRKKPL